MGFARIWARRYISEHHPHGLDASDVENMILRRLHYNKDKGERGRKVSLSSALNEAQNEGRRNFRALVPWQVKRGVPLGVLARTHDSINCGPSCECREQRAVMSVEKLPRGVPYRFAVVPRNCFGREGKPIRTDDVWRSL